MLKIQNSNKMAQVEVEDKDLVEGLDEPRRGVIGLAHASTLFFAITISVWCYLRKSLYRLALKPFSQQGRR